MREMVMVTLSVLCAAGLAPAFGGAQEKEAPASKHVRAAMDLLEKAAARLPALENLAASENATADLAGQAQAIIKEIKKARRELEWAALNADAQTKPGIEKIVESARKTSESLAALAEKASGKTRSTLVKASKEAAKTRQAGESCLSDIASGKKREDPFADTQAPSLPPNVDNLTREAIQSGTR